MISKTSILETIKKMMANYREDKVYLFGSYAYGEPHEQSDIDLLVVSKENHSVRYRQLMTARSDYPIDFDILVYSPEQVAEKATWNPLIRKILTKGIQING